MVRTIKVRQFGVMDEVEVELGPGLTVLTGETGAGKSMLIDALVLLSGGRADASMVRSGADEASVEGVFVRGPGLAERLEAAGLEGDGDEVLVRRTVAASGRGRAWVNGHLVTVSVLQQLMRGVVDIAGQLEHATLYDEAHHRELVDRFGALEGEAGPLWGYTRRHAEHRALQARLDELGGDERAVAAKVEFVRFQVSELSAAKVASGEEAALEVERRRLASTARLLELARGVDDLLSGRDGSAADLLGQATHRVGEMERVDPTVTPLRERLGAAAAELDEASRGVARYLSGLELDPGRLREVEERLDLLRSLSRKHGVGCDELPARLEALQRELDELVHRAERRAEALEALAQSRAALLEAAAELTKARQSAARRLELEVGSGLTRLALKDAQLCVQLEPAEPGPFGADQVRLLFSANPGEPPRPLAKTASGGEASRVMLALKAVLSTTEAVSVSVLDEVDTGVSGAVADVVGRLIRDLSGNRQVLCITHLPQVAAHAQQHLKVSKCVVEGRVRSTVETLGTIEARADELARLLSGSEVTREARAAAQVLLASAAKGPKTPAAKGVPAATATGSLTATKSASAPAGSGSVKATTKAASAPVGTRPVDPAWDVAPTATGQVAPAKAVPAEAATGPRARPTKAPTRPTTQGAAKGQLASAREGQPSRGPGRKPHVGAVRERRTA
ncbi:MAG: DNA repair protein RecN [Myxococcaceae bacterium]|nr:DNA repair protein RecN [Myxococcaceae bacterium]